MSICVLPFYEIRPYGQTAGSFDKTCINANTYDKVNVCFETTMSSVEISKCLNTIILRDILS